MKEAIEAKGNYTQGGWHRNIAPAWKYPTIFAGRNTHIASIISTRHHTGEEVEANCNLIAAAPDLYEALLDALESLQRLPDADNTYRATCIRQAEIALARANGQYLQD